MNRKQKLNYFLSGMMAALLMVSLIVPGFAVYSKNVTVFPGVNIFVNDQKINPTDAKGNPVEAFIYEGTTYLPIRAVSQALDLPIQWEGTSKSVYIGSHTGDKPAVWVADMNYFDKSGGNWDTGETIKDNLGNEHQHCISGGCRGDYLTYKLNAQYTRLTGVYFQRYNDRSSDGGTLAIYADDEKVWEGEMGKGIDPINISVDVTGVLELKIMMDGYTYSYDPSHTAIGELGLWT